MFQEVILESNRKQVDSATTRQKFWWLSPLLLGISAFAAIVYAAFTWSMLQELKDANSLQIEFQNQVLQPVLTIQVGRDIINAGKNNEAWRVAGQIINAGQVPARKVRGQLYWDSSPEIISFNKPFELGEVVLAPGGGSIEVEAVILKAEAVAILSQRDLYFHAIAVYWDAANHKFYSFATYRCLYSEGEFLKVAPVKSSIVSEEEASSID